jgi:hypothetical protein
MSTARYGTCPGRHLRNLATVASILLILTASTALAQQPLTFFKNYFITGDYTVRGVSLWRKGVNGTAVTQIPALEVPANTDIVAAFLYIQTAESVQGSGIEHAKFRGFDFGPYTDPVLGTPGSGTYAKPLVAWANAQAPCWSVNVPGGRKLMTYRVDVLRFLPVDPGTGKYDLSAPFDISVPDAGRLFPDDDENCKETIATPLPRALGASLLVVYRDPTKPLSAVVIYDGAYPKRALAKMVQPISGFYQASATSPAAKMTHIVGDGRALLGEQVLLGARPIARNPYTSADGPKWDDPTFANLPLPANAGSTTVTVDRAGLLPDCLTFSAIVLRTTVQDADGDGLLDAWETPRSTPLLDPRGNALPDLAAMGASPTQQDLFAEIAYMDAAEGTRYGGTPKPAHSHLPGQDALSMVAEAFHKSGISIHFDIGGHYQGAPYLPLPSLETCEATWEPRCAIIPASLARGGKRMSETAMCPQLDANGNVIATAPPVECVAADGTQGDIPGQYPKYPGTVGWKTGFQMLRDAILGFDYARKDIFHYVLFAHAVGIPKEPCQNADGTSNFDCQDPTSPQYKPDFNVPRTNSGIADFPGADVLMALGAFEDENKRPVGTEFMQGATLMHELGHNFELAHFGPASLVPGPREANCKPNYHSVMNYLYQLRGLPDANGIVRMDFSNEVLDPLNESALRDDPLAPASTVRFRSGWYAPWATSYLSGLGKPASKHCNGSDIIAGEMQMVRVDAASLVKPIDWNANGAWDLTLFAQDINFDGKPDLLGAGANDWANVRLNQLGARRNVGGYYFVPPDFYAVGPLSLDVGRGDIGRGDIGRGDIGRGDIGRGAFGGGDLDVGGDDEPFGDIDLETARAVAGNAPSPARDLTACLTSDGVCTAEGGSVPVRLSWQAPHLDQATSYSIYRFAYDPEAPFPPALLPTTPIDTVYGDGGVPPTTYSDGSAPYGQNLAYFVIAHFADESTSGISNFATVLTPNASFSISSVVPGTAASGQMVTVFTQGAPAGLPQAVFSQGTSASPGFVFESPSRQNAYVVQLPNLFLGPATVRLVFGATTTAPFPLTVAETPGAPQSLSVRGLNAPPTEGTPCGGGFTSMTPITTIVPGQGIAVSAHGINTTGAVAWFTQPGRDAIPVQSGCAISNTDIGLAAVYRVPDGLVSGPVTVQLTTTVNGVTSGLSEPVTLTVGGVPEPETAGEVRPQSPIQ